MLDGDRARATVIVVLVACLWANVTLAMPSDIRDEQNDLLGVDGLRLYLEPDLKTCHTAYCRTLYNVSYAWDLLFHRDIPNSLARLHPYPDSFFSQSALHAAHLIASAPNAVLTCRVEQKLSHDVVAGMIRDPQDSFSFLNFAELMELVSELPSGAQQCREQIAAALPQTATSAQWLQRANDLVRQNVESYPGLGKWVHLGNTTQP